MGKCGPVHHRRVEDGRVIMYSQPRADSQSVRSLEIRFTAVTTILSQFSSSLIIRGARPIARRS